MKKTIILLALSVLLLTGCKEYTVAEGIGIYDPASDDSSGMLADIPEQFSLEYLVDTADVIAKVVTEDIIHVEIIMEEKDALGEKGIFALFRYSDVYYSWTVNESEGRDANVYIDYTPLYQNVNNPGFGTDSEYIVFLKRISPDMPFVIRNFYDYYLLTDYETYKLEATSENEELVKQLIISIKQGK